jgi:uncharacterized protein
MNKEILDISHRDVIQKALSGLHSGFSEYSFTNLYLFRKVHDYYVVFDEGLLSIEGKTRDGKKYIMPLYDLASIDDEKRKQIASSAEMIFPVQEKDLALFNPEIYSYTSSSDDSDYLFHVLKLSTYPGRNLHKKRNLMKQFLEQYSWYKKDIPGQASNEALTILETWQEGTGLPEDQTDFLSCKEAIARIEEFGLSGSVYYVGDEPVGFLLGEKLSADTFALHFAKGMTRFKGVYQFMYNVFAKELGTEYEWVNFEQDLGIPELRQAKESYQPDKMAVKYRVSLK